MQTSEVASETVEEVMNLDDRTATAVANVENLTGAVRDVAQAICVGDGQHNVTNTPNQHAERIINLNETSATLRQEEVLPTGEFVNMLTEPYAFAKAFPTLFIPRYNKGKDDWLIYHDLTAWTDKIRENRGYKFTD